MRFFAGLAIAISFTLTLDAQVTMPYIFSDCMVLQRNTEIPVWGTADPGTKISVLFANNKVQTFTDKEGQWMVQIPPVNAGGPYKLEVIGEGKVKDKLVFSDVLVGDVWLASGQSNMEMQVQQSNGADTEIPHAYNSKIRFFNVPHNKSFDPLINTLESSWKVCDSNNVKATSAVAYYFARKLQNELDIPIGILQTTWGGTPVEAWTSREMLLSEPVIRERVFANDTITEQHFIQDSLNQIKFWKIVFNPQNGADTLFSATNYNDRDWRSVTVPGAIRDWETESYEGIFWLRKTIMLEKDFTGKDLTINLGQPEMNYSLYFNGTEICKTVWNASPKHKYTIPADVVREGENVISLRMAAIWGGGALYPPANAIYLANETDTMSLTGDWKYKKDLETKIPKIYNYYQFPTVLYNAMINPVIPFGLKGFIWYQGENNEGDAYNYRKLFPLMINDWRIRWEQGYLPFLFVQLPNYKGIKEEPSDDMWAVLRESQFIATMLPNVGMTCIIDLGEAGNIHPKNKIEVGNRLADVAENMVYDMEVVASGPVFQNYKIEGNKIRVRFSEIAGGLKTSNNQKLVGFSVAGADEIFHWADAVIEGDEVIVSSKEVEKPVAVRYAWADNPVCNLINSAGLPAVPFRTDTWKVITEE
ncbi:MAG: 9-O-acetylesterase [Bacteroidales bacterium]|nr:9-O-acetylesterase [Bacteroidales bacterium]MBN2818970.1 9-O-acetylesterase [Bacteroidales bacterium]